MDEQQLAEIEGRHQRYPVPPGIAPYPLCEDDGQEWPCDAARLVARVRALEKGLDLILWHATGQPVGMFDPHWYAAQASALLGMED